MKTFEIVLLIIYLFMVVIEIGFVTEDVCKFERAYRRSKTTICLAWVVIILAPISLAWQLGELLYNFLNPE